MKLGYDGHVGGQCSWICLSRYLHREPWGELIPPLLRWAGFPFTSVAYWSDDHAISCPNKETFRMKGGAIDSYTGVTGVIRPVPGDSGYMLTLLSYKFIALVAIYSSIHCRAFSTVYKSLTSVFIILFFNKSSLFLRLFT